MDVLEFRLAAMSDKDKIFQIFKAAISYMDSQNIPQWDEVYPAVRDIESDILKQEMYVLVKEDKIIAAIALNEVQDDGYETGAWTFTEGKVAVIHRLCVDPAFQNQGMAKKTMSFAEDILRKKGYSIIRLDAYSLNPYALKLYEKLGFRKVSALFFRMGKFYLFEKALYDTIIL